MAGQDRQQKVEYDLLKSMAILMVIQIHMMDVVELVSAGDLRAFHIHEVVRNLLLTSNGLFFMTSGRFLLEGYDGRIGRSYWKRFVKIGIPVLAASLCYYVYVYGWGWGDLGPHWKTFIKDLLQSHIQGYLWFVYALTGFYLAVPFLARMLKGMGRGEKVVLLSVTIGYFFIQDLYQIFHLEMAFTSYPFYSWVFYCILGYLIDSLGLTDREKRYLIIAGLCAFMVTVWEICFWEKENPSLHDYSVTMIFMTTAAYLAVTAYGKRFAGRSARIISFIGRRSFYIYLLHGLTQNILAGKLARYLNGNPSETPGESFGPGQPGGLVSWACWLGLSLLSFAMALGIGCVLEYGYRPILAWLLRAGEEKRGYK